MGGLEPGARAIATGAELVEIETNKASMVYETDDSGILSFVAQEGDTLPVGALIARLLATPEEKPSRLPAPGYAHPPGWPEPIEFVGDDGVGVISSPRAALSMSLSPGRAWETAVARS